jgi:uncharacterized protein YdiU (UPF0061 family)
MQFRRFQTTIGAIIALSSSSSSIHRPEIITGAHAFLTPPARIDNFTTAGARSIDNSDIHRGGYISSLHAAKNSIRSQRKRKTEKPLSFIHPPSISNVSASSSLTMSAMNNAGTDIRYSSTSTSSSTSREGGSQQTNHPLTSLHEQFDHSWLSQLNTETPENRLKSKERTPQDDGVSNNVKRPVYNGHWVGVKPAPLKNPRLIIHSPEMIEELGLSSESAHSDAFVKYFSGDVMGAFDDHDDAESVKQKVASWATPYALSIMGRRLTSNCPFGTGDGYGDGRAISVGEIVVADSSSLGDDTPRRYELQLKGAGPTPFCRGADGRAVLRSSIREFLASEAMHHLGVSTTRALSLIVSDNGNTSQRPWYSDRNQKNIPDIDDPRLSQYSLDQRKQIIAQLNAQSKNDPDVMIEEPNAITCRVAPSFLRIGHVDLFARRATRNLMGDDETLDTTSMEFQELEALVWHACFREFPTTCYYPYRDKGDILSASKQLLNHSLEGIASMVAGWIRVGFAQGNFNADNCLIGGRTMDYGPFGFMDEYHPLFAKWTGSGEHFGFLNQPSAGYANFAVLVSSVMPIIEAYSPTLDEAKKYQDEIMEKGQEIFQEKLMEALRSKMGFHPKDQSPDDLWSELESLIRANKTDWTLFWRQLMEVVKEYPIQGDINDVSTSYNDMFETLCGNDEVRQGSSPFYERLDQNAKLAFIDWIQKWRELLVASYKETGPSRRLSQDDTKSLEPAERMRISNPKFVLREWMLVEAYTKASPSSIQSPLFPVSIKSGQADESMVHELFELIKHPYDEGTDEQTNKYYRRAPDSALKAGGTAFMS